MKLQGKKGTHLSIPILPMTCIPEYGHRILMDYILYLLDIKILFLPKVQIGKKENVTKFKSLAKIWGIVKDRITIQTISLS